MRRLVLLVLIALAALAAAPAARAAGTRSPIPMFAYYYIWFNPSSWDRAKRDYPLLGRYSSDEERVMRTHIRWAKSAGINGFLVSWKDTPVLDQRLAKLMAVANSEHFKLGIVYQGLDFFRRPRRARDIAADLDFFIRRFSRDPSLRIYAKPLIIWSGTWEFSPREVASVTRGRRSRLLILASERNAGEYRRLSGLVDGDAYYWSSVNPRTFPDYAGKLDELSGAVHAHHGLWIAPAAPGFDARLIGGHKIVPRRRGATLRTELDTASRSNPDALGLISWNEFSENSHVEPSKRFGRNALQVLADVRGAKAPAAPADSSDPAATPPTPSASSGGVPLAAGLVGLVAIALAMVAWRSRRRLERQP
ncbi:MAG: hypothetical protein E6G10_20545 [Actinobacteria bacterium]|nr:MAG: hypothetical protein E6G10_20545 [Actinomycetota bacterium]